MKTYEAYAPSRTMVIQDEYGLKVQILRVNRHRNGVSGVGFYTVEFLWNDTDVLEPITRQMVGWVHDAWTDDGEGVPDGATSATGVDVPYGVIDIADPSNTWRGDHFATVMSKAIASYNRAFSRALRVG